ncbi:UBA domain-containing protein 7 [Yarrowia sp. B02]|nr:UBA domain-containing protein 7 [Yarrowia sp. B02]
MSKDSFADLWTSKNSTAAASKMSLAERQKQEAAKKAEQAKQWSGLDYLGGGIGGSSGSSGLGGTPISSTNTGSSSLSASNTARPTDILAAGPTASARAKAGRLTADNTGSSNPFMPSFKIIEDERFQEKVPVPKDPFDLMDMGMSAPISNTPTPATSQNHNTIEEEDDPFAVFNQPVKKAPEPEPKPVPKQKPRPRAEFQPEPAPEPARTSTPGGDKAVAELVDMGFSADQASAALAMTPSGKDVAMAIDIIMKQAHAAAKGETYVPPTQKEQPRQSRQARQAPREEPMDEWERQSRMQESSTGRSSRSREVGEGEDMFADASKVASQLGSQFMSKAGSLWSVGRKNLAKAVENYQGGGGRAADGSPAWMKDAKEYERDAGFNDSYQPMGESFKDSDDSDDDEEEARPPPRQSRPPPREARQPPKQTPPPSNGKFKFNDDEETIAPRRRRPEPKKEAPPVVKETPKETPSLVGDIWDAPAPASPAKKTTPSSSSNGGASLIGSTSAPSTNRPHVAISTMAMEMVTDGREKGAEAVKQGSYDIALEHYNQALANVPSPHILRALLLSNRAFCHLKAGDAKAAIVDSEEGITIIGPSLGAGEEVEPGKSLQEIWSKLVMRKAEGLEHQEKHQQALDQWTLLVGKGFTTKPVMDGKRRCQAIVTPKQAPKPAAKSARPAAKPAAKATSSAPAPAGKYENLDRVRASHAKTAKEEAEKAALGDVVAVKIETWRAGNEDNLRALLATLDTVLWPEVGWKKITVADLVVNKKVKINYMKAVAKTHPDKISAETSTEKKMIANGVFITLNKAWDSFKVQNNMS